MIAVVAHACRAAPDRLSAAAQRIHQVDHIAGPQRAGTLSFNQLQHILVTVLEFAGIEMPFLGSHVALSRLGSL
jgi:hypothetical protein